MAGMLEIGSVPKAAREDKAFSISGNTSQSIYKSTANKDSSPLATGLSTLRPVWGGKARM